MTDVQTEPDATTVAADDSTGTAAVTTTVLGVASLVRKTMMSPLLSGLLVTELDNESVPPDVEKAATLPSASSV